MIVTYLTIKKIKITLLIDICLYTVTGFTIINDYIF